jgi:hypothetical protein
MLTLRRYYPAPISVEDEDGKRVPITIHVARLTKDQHAALHADLLLLDDPPSLRLLGGRRAEGDEQNKNERGAYVIADSEIKNRRLVDLQADPARFEAFKTMAREDEAFAAAAFAHAIGTYVTVPSGQIEVDGEPVLTGAHLHDLYAGRFEILREIVMAIWAENTLDAAAKKAWRSLSNLVPLLREHQLAAVGTGQGGAAAPADVKASVDSAVVTASIEAPSTPLIAG